MSVGCYVVVHDDIEHYADMGQVGFLASKRVDGKLVLPEAIKVLQMKGAAGA